MLLVVIILFRHLWWNLILLLECFYNQYPFFITLHISFLSLESQCASNDWFGTYLFIASSNSLSILYIVLLTNDEALVYQTSDIRLQLQMNLCFVQHTINIFIFISCQFDVISIVTMWVYVMHANNCYSPKFFKPIHWDDYFKNKDRWLEPKQKTWTKKLFSGMSFSTWFKTLHMIKKLDNCEMFEMSFHQLVMKKKIMKDWNEKILFLNAKTNSWKGTSKIQKA